MDNITMPEKMSDVVEEAKPEVDPLEELRWEVIELIAAKWLSTSQANHVHSHLVDEGTQACSRRAQLVVVRHFAGSCVSP